MPMSDADGEPMVSEVSTGTDQSAGDVTTARSRQGIARLLAIASLLGVVVTVVIFTLLHVLPPTSDISPIRRTISEYALTSSVWAFNVAVITLAVSSGAVLAGLMMAGCLRFLSAGTVFGVLWIGGLLTLVSFPKHNWALGPSDSGHVHRMASLVAFLALPVAVILITRNRTALRDRTAARWAFWLGVGSLVWFLPILIAILASPRAWWQAIPLGLIERGLALTEVLATVTLALLIRAVTSTGRPPSASERAAGRSITGAERKPAR